MNEIKEELYQSMLIGDLTINSSTSKEILEYIEKLEQELQRKDNNWNELKKYVEEHNECWGLEPILDKIKDLENGR